jgi:hypothetical protein
MIRPSITLVFLCIVWNRGLSAAIGLAGLAEILCWGARSEIQKRFGVRRRPKLTSFGGV